MERGACEVQTPSLVVGYLCRAVQVSRRTGERARPSSPKLEERFDLKSNARPVKMRQTATFHTPLLLLDGGRVFTQSHSTCPAVSL